MEMPPIGTVSRVEMLVQALANHRAEIARLEARIARLEGRLRSERATEAFVLLLVENPTAFSTEVVVTSRTIQSDASDVGGGSNDFDDDLAARASAGGFARS